MAEWEVCENGSGTAEGEVCESGMAVIRSAVKRILSDEEGKDGNLARVIIDCAPTPHSFFACSK